ncbi:MAG: DUF4159 domain-containing protein [Gammaproteobacteria bacterium]
MMRIDVDFPKRLVFCIASLSILAVPSLFAQQTAPVESDFRMPVQIRSEQEIPFKTTDFTFVRLQYSCSTQSRCRRAWLTDYPDADQAFSNQVESLTGLSVNPDGLILQLTDPALSHYPFAYIVEAGQMSLSDDEASALRDYLLGGGFLMVDDFWGDYEWGIFADALEKVFPDRTPVELAVDHEIFQSFYYLSEARPVPGRGGARTGAEPRLMGISDDDGRLMMIICHNHDFGDAWEHLDDPWYPQQHSMGFAVPMGINIVTYALTH